MKVVGVGWTDELSVAWGQNEKMKKKRKCFHLPNNERTPQACHIRKLIPTEPVLTSKPDGDTKIPDPAEKEKYKS